MNRDFLDMLSVLSEEGVEFLIVGAHALAVHGHPRATGDLDVWINPTSDNAVRALRALQRFGAPLHDLTTDDLRLPTVVFQIGLPPSRIDILTGISGVSFPEAWERRVTVTIEGLSVAILGRDDFLTNKRLVGRQQDLSDVARLCGETTDES
ncbi:MAG: nucleotidyltransferase [Vicinamibacteraceae bacterium]